MQIETSLRGVAASGAHTRKEFLKRGALVVAAASVPFGIPSFYDEAKAAPRAGFRVVALTPESGLVATLGESLFSGMRLYFGGSGAVRLSRRSFRGGEGAAVEAAKGAAGGADLVVSFLSPEVAEAVRAEVSDTPLVNLHAGANVPRGTVDALENTLSHWQSAFAAGRWAARNVGGRAVEVMSCYDAGYDASYAFRVGFEGAGGEVVGTFVTHLPSEPSSGLDSAISGVRSADPDVVYASYCGGMAAEFLGAYSRAGLARTIPLLGSSFLTDDGAARSVGVRSFGPWVSGGGGKANRKFVTGYAKKYRRTPNSVAMLGYETAGIISAALRKKGEVSDALRSVSFDGPRGVARLGGGGQVFAREMKKVNGRYVNVASGGFREKVAGVDQVPRITEGSKTGWLENYLVK